MTDELIIKNFRNGVYKNKPMLFGQKFLGSVLDLINRQKAEIERLKIYSENLEISQEHLLNECTVDEIKSEAIKEFAERLKESRNLNQICIAIVSKDEIDNLVKEMTEVKENEM